ncbi:MAG: VacJ family lipoprotein [Pseudomonadota bacterium]
MTTFAKATAGLLLVTTAGCASSGNTTSTPGDPFEGFNRTMYGFNDELDKAVLEPVAKGYRAVTNKPIRKGVRNFLGNLREPVTFVNNVLQGDLVSAGDTTGRFLINSTVGLVGILDVANNFESLEGPREDFGQTLGVWGVEGGPYLVLPFLGSTNPRDLLGTGADIAFDPLTWTEFEGDDAFMVGRAVVGAISAREGAIETIDNLRSTQADPYTAVRRIYGQTRAAAIRNGEEDPSAYENLPDFDEEYEEY